MKFMYENIEEFEELVGYKVGEPFRIGFDMARTMICNDGAISMAGNKDLNQCKFSTCPVIESFPPNASAVDAALAEESLKLLEEMDKITAISIELNAAAPHRDANEPGGE